MQQLPCLYWQKLSLAGLGTIVDNLFDPLLNFKYFLNYSLVQKGDDPSSPGRRSGGYLVRLFFLLSASISVLQFYSLYFNRILSIFPTVKLL
jgi:hypothetical protein